MSDRLARLHRFASRVMQALTQPSEPPSLTSPCRTPGRPFGTHRISHGGDGVSRCDACGLTAPTDQLLDARAEPSVGPERWVMARSSEGAPLWLGRAQNVAQGPRTRVRVLVEVVVEVDTNALEPLPSTPAMQRRVLSLPEEEVLHV